MSAMFWVKNKTGDLIYLGKFPKLTDDARKFLRNSWETTFKGLNVEPEGMLFNEDNMTLTKDLIGKSIEMLGKESKRLAEAFHKRDEEWKKSEICKSMNERLKELSEQKAIEHTKMSKKKHKIVEKYLEVRPYSGGWYSPRASMSKTYGENVRPEVIDAIKKAFVYKKLSGGAIEDIVNKMISHDIQLDKEIKKSEEKQRQIQIEVNTGQNVRDKKNKSFMAGFEDSGYFMRGLIDELKEWKASEQFKEGDASMKDAEISSYSKKKIREKYRADCVQNFKEAYNVLWKVKGDK